MKISKKMILLSLLMLSFLPRGVEAKYRYPVQFNPRAEQGHYEREVVDKLVRGGVNAIYSWTELVRTPTDWAARDETTFKVLALGIPTGLMRSIARLFVGAYEIATFYAPQDPIMYEIQGDVR